MNGINADMSKEAPEGPDDLDNLPHNLARYARSSYSKKVYNFLIMMVSITLTVKHWPIFRPVTFK